MKLTAGVEAKYAKDMNYKTMDDLLGGNQWIDIDQFAERDYPANPDIIQNDINNPNRYLSKKVIFLIQIRCKYLSLQCICSE